MTDPFDVLRERLVAAAERRAPQPRHARRRARVMALVAAAALVTSSAVAAVRSFTDEPSAPLAGTEPTVALDVSRYSVELFPQLSAGRIGWCTLVAIRGRSAGGVSGEGCGPAMTRAASLIAGGGQVSSSPAASSLEFVVVDRRVAAIRLADGRRVVPSASGQLPFGWRAAVWFSSGSTRYGDWRLLDAHGDQISRGPERRAGTSAAGTAAMPTHAVDPSRSPEVPCAIRVRRTAKVRAVSERVVGSPRRGPIDVNGGAFQSCAAVVLYVAERRLTAALLFDAQQPSRPAPAPPGARPNPTTPGLIDASGKITARRAGQGWLVVRGGRPGDRLVAMRALDTR
jgi:hypothetical protein